MINGVSLNTIINQVVYSVDHLLEKKEYPQELLNYLYLIVAGMITTYGDTFVEEVYDTLLETSIKLPSCSCDNLDTPLTFYENPTRNDYLYKNIDFTNSFSNLMFQYEMLFTTIDNSFIKTLEYMTYTLNTLLFHRKDKVSWQNNLKIRFDHFAKRGCTFYDKNDSLKTIEKVFLVLQTEDIIKNILSFRNYTLVNPKFKEALEQLENISIDSYKMEGLDILVTLIRPIYEIKEMKAMINSFEGTSLFEKEINKILGKNAFIQLASSIDSLNKMIQSSNTDQPILYYDLSMKYVYLRNNYINKFMQEKYA